MRKNPLDRGGAYLGSAVTGAVGNDAAGAVSRSYAGGSVDPANNTWEAKIDAGNDGSVDWDSEIPYDVTTNPYGLTSTQKLAFRQEDESVGGFIHFHCRSTPNGDEHAISFDSVEICQPCIPEPSMMVLVLSALGGLVLVRRR